jgi:hypothetical protein
MYRCEAKCSLGSSVSDSGVTDNAEREKGTEASPELGKKLAGRASIRLRMPRIPRRRAPAQSASGSGRQRPKGLDRFVEAYLRPRTLPEMAAEELKPLRSVQMSGDIVRMLLAAREAECPYMYLSALESFLNTNGLAPPGQLSISGQPGRPRKTATAETFDMWFTMGQPKKLGELAERIYGEAFTTGSVEDRNGMIAKLGRSIKRMRQQLGLGAKKLNWKGF